MIQIRSAAQLTHVLKSNPLVVVDFFASWCTPCKHMAEYLHKVQQINPELPIVKVDVDDEELREVAELFQVVSLPTLLFVKDGNVIHRVGGMDIEQVNQGLTKLNT